MVKEDPIQEFISSRQRPETQADAALLISFLMGARQEGDGWIRTNEIQRALIDTGRIKSQKTLFRFLKELEDRGIIEKEPRVEHTPRSHSDKTKENIYYRLKVVPRYQPPLEIPIMDRIALRYAELAAAKELLKPYYDDPDAAIQEKVREMYGLTIEPDTEEQRTGALYYMMTDREQKQGPHALAKIDMRFLAPEPGSKQWKESIKKKEVKKKIRS